MKSVKVHELDTTQFGSGQKEETVGGRKEPGFGTTLSCWGWGARRQHLATGGGLSEEDRKGGDPRSGQVKVLSGFLLKICGKTPASSPKGELIRPGSKCDTQPLLEDQSPWQDLMRRES